MNTEIELRTNEHHITDHIELFFLLNMSRLIRKILWPRFLCVISLNLSETLFCWSVRASLVNR